MNVRDALDVPAREITDEAVYRDRRRILAALGLLPALGVAGCSEAAPPPSPVTVTPEQAKAGFRTGEEQTRELDATTYNNFYEFGTGKDDPSNAAKTLRTTPWTVAVGGHCARPGKLSLDDLLATGLYGKPLPQQNGAPLRLVVPWKYGFKGIKSIVAITFVERMPKTSWNMSQPSEYGFFSNVNPVVDHPRWSQKTERRIAGNASKLFAERIPTRPFNGYAEQVAALYAGMDLKKWF